MMQTGYIVSSTLVTLSSERAAFCKSGAAASGLAQHRLAVAAHHHRLRMAKDSGYVKAPLALHIHEE